MLYLAARLQGHYQRRLSSVQDLKILFEGHVSLAIDLHFKQTDNLEKRTHSQKMLSYISIQVNQPSLMT